MKKSNYIRSIALLLIMVMILPANIASALSVTTNGLFVATYNSKDTSDKTGNTTRFSGKSVTDEGDGWYSYVDSSGKTLYILASSVSDAYATATPTPTITPTPNPNATATPTPNPNATATATATSNVIEGQTDATYDGTILSYTVPTGGLWLYAKTGDTTPSVNVTSGTTIKLSSYTSTWYSTYYNSKTYYVPVSAITSGISYKVTSEGLYLYSKTVASDEYKSKTPLAEGTVIRLNPVENSSAWYSYYNGVATYYVLKSDTTNTESSFTHTVTSAGLKLYKLTTSGTVSSTVSKTLKEGDKIILTVYSADSSWYMTTNAYDSTTTYYAKKTDIVGAEATPTPSSIRSVLIDTTTNLYTKYSSTGVTEDSITSNKLTAGTRVNARYVNAYVYSYTINSTTYYFKSSAVVSGSQSTAEVSSNTTSSLMSYIAFKAGTKLYVSQWSTEKEKNSTSYHELKNDETLYGVKIDSNWYKVMYASEIFYVYYGNEYSFEVAAEIDTENSGQVVESGTNSNSTLYVTVGSAGAMLFTRPDATYTTSNSGRTYTYDSKKTLAAGQTVLASQYSSSWYTYVIDGTLYYFQNSTAATSTSTDSVSSVKVYLPAGTKLFQTTVYKADTDYVIELTTSAYYSVKSVNDKWYSIVYNSATYYIYKEQLNKLLTEAASTWKLTITKDVSLFNYDTGLYVRDLTPTTLSITGHASTDTLPPTPTGVNSWYKGYTTIDGTNYLLDDGHISALLKASEVEEDIIDTTERPIATTVDGQTYYITIVVGGGTLYRDSNCTQAASKLGGGQVVLATRYTSSLYLVDGFYLPVKYVASVKGGDDAAAVDSGSSGSVADIISGETNSAYESEVLSYTIPTGGLYLYNKADISAKSIILSAGSTIKLNALDTTGTTIIGDWYTTWYGGTQYYVPASALTLNIDDTSTSSSFSIVLSQDVKLHSSATMLSSSSDTPYKLDSTYETSTTLKAGTRINVKPYSYLSSSELAAYTPYSSSDSTKIVKVYAYTVNDKTYYFQGFTGYKITKDLAEDTIFYASKSKSSSNKKLSELSGDTNLSLLKVASDWYRTTTKYNDSYWYVPSTSVTNSYTVSSGKELTLYKTQSKSATTVTVKADSADVKLEDFKRINSTWYSVSYTPSGGSKATYYILTSDIGDILVDEKEIADAQNVYVNNIYAALVGSNTDTSLITQIMLDAAIFYTSPDKTGTYINYKGGTLYGVKYNDDWYKVIYNDSAWYLPSSYVTKDNSTQITITDGVATTTYTVVIGEDGTKLYTKPSTNTSKVTTNGIPYDIGEQNLYKGHSLKAGETVTASKYSSSWYAYAYEGQTLYFQNSKAANTNSDASITSYRIYFDGSKGIKLYSSISSIYLKEATTWTPDPGTYTLRYINETWSSVVYQGTTYYIKNKELPEDELENKTSIASTSVGNSYTITIGEGEEENGVKVGAKAYTNSLLTGNSITLAAGLTLTGKLIYVQNATNSSQLVYQVTVGGVTRYIDFDAVAGVASGDEATEASSASSSSSNITTGSTITKTCASGTVLYKSKSTSATKLTLTTATNLTFTKVDSSWYSTTYNGTTYYVPVSTIEGTSTASTASSTSSSSSVGTTYYVTFTDKVGAYEEPDSSSNIVAVILAGEKLSMTKVNDSWYESYYNSKYIYIRAVDINWLLNNTSSTMTSSSSSSTSTSTSSSTVSVGQSISYTFTAATAAYASTDDTTTSMAAIISAGQTLTLTLVTTTWYSFTSGSLTLYVKASDVNLGTSTTSTTTTDSSGYYITTYLLISPTSGSVNLRKSASTGSTILARIPKGTQVLNNSYTVDSNKQVWYNVTYNGQTGYVLGTYVSPVGTVSSSTSTGTSSDPSGDIGKSLTVNVSVVNVRSGAGTGYTIIGKLVKDTVVIPTDYTYGTDGMLWYKFLYGGSTYAYIRADYLSGSTLSSGQSGNVAIKSSGTNIRTGPGSSFGVVTKLNKDTIVTIVGTGTDSNGVEWYQIKVDNVSGYVRSDLVRPLSSSEQAALISSVSTQYTELKSGDTGDAVKALQNQLINTGYLAAGKADGIYGSLTIAAVKAFQSANGLSATGVATAATQAALYNTSTASSGSTTSLDWFSVGYALINKYPNIQVYDINAGITWSAKYINGANHADVIPASKADATKLTAYSITGSYVRRPVIVTINGSKYAGSMYAIGHGTTNYCNYFSGVMCIHFTGSKTHGSAQVDSDHQAAINSALTSGY